jgi:type II secretion system protein I
VKNGFTLLEVLIALSIFAMSMLGIYSLVNHSANMLNYGRDKLYISDKAYERVMLSIFYPAVSYAAVEDTENYGTISYDSVKNPTLLPGVRSVILTAKSDSASVTFEYFERQ